MTLIDCTIGDKPFNSAIYSATSVLGVSKAFNETVLDVYIDAVRYSPIIASVVTVVRMLVLYKAYKRH